MEESRVPCLRDAVRQGIPYVVPKAFQKNWKAFSFMVTVYVLLSQKDKASYVGMALNAESRLREHNSGKNRYTKAHIPWIISYSEQHPDWAVARIREKYLKSAAGKKWLQKYFESNGGITGSLPA